MDDKIILKVLGTLNLTVYNEISHYLIKEGFNRQRANDLVKFLEKSQLAELIYDNELRFSKIAESEKPVNLKGLSIKAKLTIEGQKFLSQNPSKNKKFIQDWSQQLKVNIPSGIIVGVVVIIIVGFFAVNSNRGDNFTFTVFVHGEKGEDDIILKEGSVMLDLVNDRRTGDINKKGVAIINGIPSNMEGDSVKVFIIHNEPYMPVNRNKKYELKNNGTAYLEVKLYGSNILYGNVLESNGQGLDSVRVSIRDISTYTDQYGYYELTIPSNYQKKLQNVRYEKKGYMPVNKNNIPVHTGQSLDLILRR